MAKRLVCCPSVGEGGRVSFRYLYIDSLELIAEDVTDALRPLDANLEGACCFDKLVGYANGSMPLDENLRENLPFDFYQLNSFELFRNPDELRLKTGSEKILHQCLLNYYRREYDGTQQHTFFSDPGSVWSRGGGVEHELTLENRTFIENKEEEFIPETLDKGKSMAEREAEALMAQLQLEQEEALAEADAKAEKKEKREKNRKRAKQRAEYENERYNAFRNEDNVRSKQYQRVRQYEEEMRANNGYLASQYVEGNYESLPGYIPPQVFSASYESFENATVGAVCKFEDLYAVASRLDEHGVDYTVVQKQAEDGLPRAVVLLSSVQADSAQKAIDFYSLEKQLYADKAIFENIYLNSFQLQAMDFAYEHHIDTSYVRSGEFNSSQMFRILEAGLDGKDMSVVANPDYAPAQMDAINYFSRQGWDTTPICTTELSMQAVADNIFREELQHRVPSSDSFFEQHNYDSFISYPKNGSFVDYLNSYDDAYRRNLYYNASQIKDVRVPDGAVLGISKSYSPEPYSVPDFYTAQDGRSYFKDGNGKLHDGSGNLYLMDKDGCPKPIAEPASSVHSPYSGIDRRMPDLSANEQGGFVDYSSRPAVQIPYSAPVPIMAPDGRSYYKDVSGNLYDGGGNIYRVDKTGVPQPVAGPMPIPGSSVLSGTDGIKPEVSAGKQSKGSGDLPKSSASVSYATPVPVVAKDGRSYYKDGNGNLYDGSGNLYRVDKAGIPQAVAEFFQRPGGPAVVGPDGKKSDVFTDKDPAGASSLASKESGSTDFSKGSKLANYSSRVSTNVSYTVPVPFVAQDGRSYFKDKVGNLYDGNHNVYRLDKSGYPQLATEHNRRTDGPGTIGADGKRLDVSTVKDRAGESSLLLRNSGPHEPVSSKGSKTDGNSVKSPVRVGYTAPAPFAAKDGRTYFKAGNGALYDGSSNVYLLDKEGVPNFIGHSSELSASSILQARRILADKGSIDKGVSSLKNKGMPELVMPKDNKDGQHSIKASTKNPYTVPAMFVAKDGRSYFKDGVGMLHDGSGNRYLVDGNSAPKIVLQKMGRSEKGSSIVRAQDGRTFIEKSNGVLLDSKGREYSLNRKGQLKRVNSYSFGGHFVPDGYVGGDSSFVKKASFKRLGPLASNAKAGEAVGDSLGKKPQGPSPESMAAGRGSRPLDGLHVRRTFAERAGLRLERFGNKTLYLSKQTGQYMVSRFASFMSSADDTETLSTVRRGYHIGEDIVTTALIIRDLPRMFGKPRQGISYTSEAIKTAGGHSLSRAERREQAIPLQVKPWKEYIERVNEKFLRKLEKDFGPEAAYWSVKDIDKQIEACTSDLLVERKKLVPINQRLKAELNALHPAAKASIQKDDLIQENRKLKEDIKKLQKKDNLTAAEQERLANKIAKKRINEQKIRQNVKTIDGLSVDKNALLQENRRLKAQIKSLQKNGLTAAQKEKLAKLLEKKAANEKEIGRLTKEIKKQKPIIDKDVKKAAKLNKEKRANEKVLNDKGRRVKDLKRLKKRKLDFQERMKELNNKLRGAEVAKRRLTSLPGRLLNKVVTNLQSSGDLTLSGIGQATGFAMSFARNSLVRLAARSVKSIFVKLAPGKNQAVKAKSLDKVSDVVEKAKNVEKVKKAGSNIVQSAKNAEKAANVSKLTSKSSKKIAKGSRKYTARQFGQKKGVKEWIKRSSKKAIEASRAAAAGAKGLLGIGGGAAAGGGGAAAAGSGAAAAGGAAAGGGGLLAAGGIALVVIIVLIALVLIISSVSAPSSSYVLTDSESEDGRIDLSDYVGYINEFQEGLQEEIERHALGTSSVTNRPYDNVFYDYSGESNSLHLLTMAYVRFGFDLSDKDAVKAYMEQLYKDSNLVDSAESDLYSCANGCVEREYKCYEEYDEFATNTRISLYDASDHSDYALVGEAKGCKYESYSCMEKGHNVYNKNGCLKQHNDGEPMSSYGSCDNYSTKYVTQIGEDGNKETVPQYICKGHCNGKHRDYYCDGHTETVCYGEHQDLTVTISSLGFDEIFYADTAMLSSGSFAKGDAYEKKFTITAYCSCHDCCHPYDEACTGNPPQTASGTTPKANHTIAVDPDVIPLGTHVWINGKEYVAEDTGGAIDGYRIDIYFDSHQEALNWGKRTLTVYKSKVIETGGNTGDAYGFDGWTEENIELVKNIYANMIADDANELYYGLDAFTSLSYGNYEGDYDFSGVDFGVLDESSLTTLQKAVLAVIQANDLETQKGYCQAWVADVYRAAGTGARMSKCCANHAGEAWGVSNDWSDIQVGATVYGYSSSIYGHVGIYIGNGKVAHNIGYVKIESLESWVKTYNGICWGWNSYNLTGLSQYACKPSGTFMNGKD